MRTNQQDLTPNTPPIPPPSPTQGDGQNPAQSFKDISDEKFLALFNICREEDRHECNLINHRMTWLVTVQSFLIASYSIIAVGAISEYFRIGVTIVLFVIGILSATQLIRAVHAAERVIKDWHSREAILLLSNKTEAGPYESQYRGLIDIERQWPVEEKDYKFLKKFLAR